MADQHPLSTEILLETPSGDRANIKNLPAPVMQALYYQITGKREKYSKIFDGDYIINKDYIRDLVLKLEQTLLQFSVQGSNLSATIIHFKKDKQDCSSLEKFAQYDSTRTDPVSSILLRFDFLITPPGTSAPQNYTISITFKSFVLLKKDRFASRGIGLYTDTDHAILVDIDYVDYVVARSFQSTLDEWVSSLPKNRILRFPGWLLDTRYSMIESLKVLIAISATYFLYTALFGYSLDINGIFLGVVIFTVFRSVSDYVVDIIDDMLFPHAQFPFIIMNRGDERNLERFKEKRRRYVALGFALITGAIAGVIANIASTPIVRSLF